MCIKIFNGNPKEIEINFDQGAWVLGGLERKD